MSAPAKEGLMPASEIRPDLRAARAEDLDALAALLESADLPTAGVAEWLPRFVVAEDQGELLGAAGLEVHGRDAVLRSVVVAPSMRGAGLGHLLTERVLAEARGAGIRRVYLLTTTAEAYFPRWGFRRISREEASDDVRRSVEFAEACPASAVVMVLDLET